MLGAHGFVGRSLVKQLATNYSNSVGAYGRQEFDLTDSRAVSELSQQWDESSSVVICAGKSKSPRDSLDVLSYNLQIAMNLAAALRSRPVRRVVYFSSAGVYGEEVTNSVTAEAAVPRPQTFYSLSKLTAEHVFSLELRALPTSLLILRPSWIYGLGDPSPYGPSAFVRAALAGQEITLWGDGSETRDFLYVEDAARLTLALLFSQYSGVVNVCSGHARSFRDSISIIEKLLGRKLHISTRPRTKQQVDCAFERSRLEQLVQCAKCLTLEQGIMDMLSRSHQSLGIESKVNL